MNDKIIFTVPAQQDASLKKLPNLYATISYSPNALSSYMAFVQAQARGSFHAKEREAVYLIVSQLNGCEYCLASHTQSALKAGWTEDETILLRKGTYVDMKWKIIYKVISSVIANRGEVSDELLHLFFNEGYHEKELIDLMTLTSIMSFTNYVFRLTKIPIDFPPATALTEAA
jgi:AhpD family alkylhydroperoxidase